MQRTIWLLAFVLAATASAGIWAVTVLGDRRAVLQAAAVQLAATARLLEQHADRALVAGDRAVLAIRQAVGDPRRLADPAEAAALHERLKAILDGSRQLPSAWVMDAEGHTIAETWAHPPLTTGSFAHRSYFQAAQAGDDGLHVGLLGMGQNMGRRRFTLSRPLLAPDGSFAGVVATAVYSDYFAEIYADAALGADARLLLFRIDGAPLAIWPPLRGEMPRELPGELPGDPTAPGPLLPEPGDGRLVEEETRLVALRRLERYPVGLLVSRSRRAVLADWRQRTWRSGGLTLAAILALGGLTALGLRGAERQRALTVALGMERASLERRVAERTAALAESEARFREMADNAPVMIWVTDATGHCTVLARPWYAFTGQPPRAGLGFGWLEAVHPEDRAPIRAALAAVRERRAPFRLELRLRRHDGAWRWMIAAAAPRLGADDAFLGTIGSILDITDRREAEERQALMARELDHRAKNALTVVQAALRLTPRADAAHYARAVEGRVAALARAHSVLAEGRWQGASLRAVIEAELATFLGATDGEPAATLDGPPIRLRPAAVQALSMALHELATNATKYGALSRPGGRLRVGWSIDRAAGRLLLRWEERGGPPLDGPPARPGFGTRVLEGTVGSQLGGTVERRWAATGLTCTLSLPLARLEAEMAEAANAAEAVAEAALPGGSG